MTEVQELKHFFENVKDWPTEPVVLSPGNVVFNPRLFAESHLLVTDTYKGLEIGEPYLTRLKMLRKFMENNK